MEKTNKLAARIMIIIQSLLKTMVNLAQATMTLLQQMITMIIITSLARILVNMALPNFMSLMIIIGTIASIIVIIRKIVLVMANLAEELKLIPGPGIDNLLTRIMPSILATN